MSRQTLLPKMAQHVLANGISGVSLRPLAKAAGTSDRMLIYHFGNRQGAIDAVLEYLGQMFAEGLELALPAKRAATRAETVRQILSITATPQLRPYLQLWWELVAESARGNQTFQESARAIIEMLLGWLEAHMPEEDPDPAAGARLALTLIEGSQMLDAVSCGAIAEAGLAEFAQG